jgi:hypothetical protein
MPMIPLPWPERLLFSTSLTFTLTGLNVVCVTPGEPWYIDARAANCTKVADFSHRCWVRHGTLGGCIHVDKDGNTCSAGNGSIQRGAFHGFLHQGELYDA